jgi:hypothetical protein
MRFGYQPAGEERCLDGLVRRLMVYPMTVITDILRLAFEGRE